MEFYERVSGARMHAAYVRPGGVALVISNLMLFRPEKRVLILVIWQAILKIRAAKYNSTSTQNVESGVFWHLCR